MTHTMIQGDCYHLITPKFLRLRNIETVFINLPDNVSRLRYRNEPRTTYLNRVKQLVETCVPHTNSLFISFHANHTAAMGHTLYPLRHEITPIIQLFKSGNFVHNKLTNCHRPLWLITCNLPETNERARLIDQPEYYQQRIRSISPRPRVSGEPVGHEPTDIWQDSSVNLWHFPQDEPKRPYKPAFYSIGPRLVARAIALVAPKSTGVLDLFAGKGVVADALKLPELADLGLSYHGIERDEKAAKKICRRHPEIELTHGCIQ